MLKLLAQPIEQIDPVGSLDGALCVANRDVLPSGTGKLASASRFCG
ncbi:MAG: hypothetical protein RMK84_09350 [Oscillochloridaceae bacterium]|nr:hypothetical protein [Chloroflexaceae bacterium]MDW8390319.1 hypothetical protein [Oscillochloridaceae bacterium]